MANSPQDIRAGQRLPEWAIRRRSGPIPIVTSDKRRIADAYVFVWSKDVDSGSERLERLTLRSIDEVRQKTQQLLTQAAKNGRVPSRLVVITTLPNKHVVREVWDQEFFLTPSLGKISARYPQHRKYISGLKNDTIQTLDYASRFGILPIRKQIRQIFTDSRLYPTELKALVSVKKLRRKTGSSPTTNPNLPKLQAASKKKAEANRKTLVQRKAEGPGRAALARRPPQIPGGVNPVMRIQTSFLSSGDQEGDTLGVYVAVKFDKNVMDWISVPTPVIGGSRALTVGSAVSPSSVFRGSYREFIDVVQRGVGQVIQKHASGKDGGVEAIRIYVVGSDPVNYRIGELKNPDRKVLAEYSLHPQISLDVDYKSGKRVALGWYIPESEVSKAIKTSTALPSQYKSAIQSITKAAYAATLIGANKVLRLPRSGKPDNPAQEAAAKLANLDTFGAETPQLPEKDVEVIKARIEQRKHQEKQAAKVSRGKKGPRFQMYFGTFEDAPGFSPLTADERTDLTNAHGVTPRIARPEYVSDIQPGTEFTLPPGASPLASTDRYDIYVGLWLGAMGSDLFQSAPSLRPLTKALAFPKNLEEGLKFISWSGKVSGGRRLPKPVVIVVDHETRMVVPYTSVSTHVRSSVSNILGRLRSAAKQGIQDHDSEKYPDPAAADKYMRGALIEAFGGSRPRKLYSYTRQRAKALGCTVQRGQDIKVRPGFMLALKGHEGPNSVGLVPLYVTVSPKVVRHKGSITRLSDKALKTMFKKALEDGGFEHAPTAQSIVQEAIRGTMTVVPPDSSSPIPFNYLIANKTLKPSEERFIRQVVDEAFDGFGLEVIKVSPKGTVRVLDKETGVSREYQLVVALMPMTEKFIKSELRGKTIVRLHELPRDIRAYIAERLRRLSPRPARVPLREIPGQEHTAKYFRALNKALSRAISKLRVRGSLKQIRIPTDKLFGALQASGDVIPELAHAQFISPNTANRINKALTDIVTAVNAMQAGDLLKPTEFWAKLDAAETELQHALSLSGKGRTVARHITSNIAKWAEENLHVVEVDENGNPVFDAASYKDLNAMFPHGWSVEVTTKRPSLAEYTFAVDAKNKEDGSHAWVVIRPQLRTYVPAVQEPFGTVQAFNEDHARYLLLRILAIRKPGRAEIKNMTTDLQRAMEARGIPSPPPGLALGASRGGEGVSPSHAHWGTFIHMLWFRDWALSRFGVIEGELRGFRTQYKTSSATRSRKALPHGTDPKSTELLMSSGGE